MGGGHGGGAKHTQRADGFTQSLRHLNFALFQLKRLLLPSLCAGSPGVMVGLLLLLTMSVVVIPVPLVVLRCETALNVSLCSEMA